MRRAARRHNVYIVIGYGRHGKEVAIDIRNHRARAGSKLAVMGAGDDPRLPDRRIGAWLRPPGPTRQRRRRSPYGLESRVTARAYLNMPHLRGRQDSAVAVADRRFPRYAAISSPPRA